MQRILALVLTLAILLISVFEKSSVAEASDFVAVTEAPIGVTPVPVATSVPLENGNYNGAVYAAANILTWELLQTYLYGIAGQQAYDAYANDAEAQEALYADYCDWWETTKKGTAMGFVGLVYMADGVTQGAMKLSTQASDVYSYYKTAGSSALQEMQDEAYKQWQVIKGGLKESGNEPQASPTPTLGKEATKIIGISGIGTLIGCIGGYIKELVSGNRGEVSEAFLGTDGVSTGYFGGSYNFDELNNCYFMCNGTNVLDVTCSEINSPIALRVNIGGEVYSRLAGYIYGSVSYDNETYCNVIFGRYNNVTGQKQLVTSELEYFANGSWKELFGYRLLLKQEEVSFFSDIPIFASEAEAVAYMQTGDLSNCINYFNEADIPSRDNWLNYDLAGISAQLEQILQALTTLPTITTDDLAGFAAGVSAGINANMANIQAMTQAQLQQFMANLNTENAKKTATQVLSETSPYDDTLEDDTTNDNTATPVPTTDPLIEEKQTNGKMMVDLSKFFPFCVPYDLVRLIKVLDAEPKAPKFETTLKYDKLGINEKITLDLALFDDVASVCRLCELILVILGLILVTRDLIRG